jgi:predicted RNA binding protein YcfA (HicA-like mRNA interferase family)
LPRLKRLSGDQVIAILAEFGFREHSQRGSHVKLALNLGQEARATVIVPRRRQIGPGLLRAIIREASEFVPEALLKQRFYTD